MLDLKFIRENPDLVAAATKAKKVTIDIKKVLRLDVQKRKTQAHAEELRALQRQLSDAIPKAGAKERKKLIVDSTKLKVRFLKYEEELKTVESALEALLLTIPNVPLAGVTVGNDESDNQVIRLSGTPKKFSFTPKPHWELGDSLGILDNERASKVSGARFTYVKGKLALLQFAIIQFVLKTVTDEKTLATIAQKAKLSVSTKPFVPILPPMMIRPDVFAKMARLEPREERYHFPTDDLYLIGSAEHTLGSMHLNETFEERDLPVRYIGYSASFRREAGSYGKDTRGIIRLHQFDKLEMESFTTSAVSQKEQDFFVAIQEYLVHAFELPYRVVAICTGDMGGPDARQIDIDTWMPGQDRYCETHTADLMTDYQARRLGTRVRRTDGSHEFVHMNDGTAFALGRIMAAILENYQEEDGSIRVPTILIPLCGFDRITKE